MVSWSRVGRDSLVYWWCCVDVLFCFGMLFCGLVGFYGFVLRWVWLCLGCVCGVLVVRSWCESDSWDLSQATWCTKTQPNYHHIFTNTPPNHDFWWNIGGVLVVWVGLILYCFGRVLVVFMGCLIFGVLLVVFWWSCGWLV